jgi:hypothetical protein
MKSTVFNLIAYFLFVPVTAKTTDGVLFSVRQPNGVDQHYQLVVPPDLQPAAPVNPRAWVTPGAATNKISAQNATIVAVAWAGGLSKRATGGPPNSLMDVGGSPAGGFYNASYVRPDSVELRNGPIPYYLVRMTGVIGNTRQTLYAAVLEDGRIIQPMPISTSHRAAHPKAVHHSTRQSHQS